MFLKIIAIGFGGLFGAILRYLSTELIKKNINTKIPYDTLFVNLAGSFLIGFLLEVLIKNQTNELIRLFFIIGFLGAFTTFATYSNDIYQLIKSQYYFSAMGYFLLHTIPGIILVFLGIKAGSKL